MDDPHDYWLDVQDAEPDALRELFDTLGVAASLLDECIIPSRRRITTSEKSLLLGIPICLQPERGQAAPLFVICIPHVLLTVQGSAVSAIPTLMTRLMGSLELPEPTNAALLHLILTHIFEEHMLVGLEIRNQVIQLETLLDADVDAIEVRQIVSLKKQVAYMSNTFQDQAHVVAFLQQVESPAFHIGNQRRHYRDLEHEIEQAMRVGERIEGRLRDMHQHYLLSLQEKANKKLNLLTIIQAVFVPLTLIAGIYGMNFTTIPELAWPYGYFVILGAMGVIAAVELWLFWRGGWFD